MRILGWCLLWLISLIIYAAFTGGNCLKFYELSKHGVKILGTFGHTQPHLQIRYSFEIEGRSYEGIGRIDVGVPSLSRSSLGGAAPVYFLPNAPEVNCLGDPKQLFSSELLSVVSGSLLFPSILILILGLRFGLRSAKPRRKHS